tara:strand:- start:1978 stop:2484 length:507 start_codon:yes stop_codon:yes gene_type:complete
MAISFLTSTQIEVDVYLTFDPSIELDEDQKTEYLTTGIFKGTVKEGATVFTLKALSPSEREDAEVKAGSYTRSELGRMLWIESPSDEKEKARWHHNLEEDEKQAFASYQSYINRVYLEMIRASLLKIDGEEASLEMIQSIRPDSHRVQSITELVLHIQRLSLVGESGK